MNTLIGRPLNCSSIVYSPYCCRKSNANRKVGEFADWLIILRTRQSVDIMNLYYKNGYWSYRILRLYWEISTFYFCYQLSFHGYSYRVLNSLTHNIAVHIYNSCSNVYRQWMPKLIWAFPIITFHQLLCFLLPLHI